MKRRVTRDVTVNQKRMIADRYGKGETMADLALRPPRQLPLLATICQQS
jgi:hypothetical protein